VPLECVFPYNFLSALVVRTLAPLILVVALVLAGRRATRRGNEALGYLLMNSGVLLVFMVYPSVTQYCFRFFQVKTFDDVGDTATFPHVGGTYLIADYSVDADGGAYIAMTPFAAAMVCVWPFGVPLLIAILLWRSRAPLLEFRRREMILGGVYGGDAWAAHLAERTQIGEQVHASGQAEPEVDGYLWSLTESYSATVFYFEFLEYVIQKLILVGLLVFFQPGTLEQLTLGLVVCFFYFGLCCYLQPFGSKADNLMVCVTQFSLFIAMLTAVIIEHGGPDTPQSVVTILSFAALTPFALSIILTFQLLFNELGFHPLGLCWRPIERACTQRIFRSLRSPTSSSPDPRAVVATAKSATKTDVKTPSLLSPTALQTEIDALRLSLAEERQGREAAERAAREERQLREAAEASHQQGTPAKEAKAEQTAPEFNRRGLCQSTSLQQTSPQSTSLQALRLTEPPRAPQADRQPQSSAPSRMEEGGASLNSSLRSAPVAVAATERAHPEGYGPSRCLQA